MRGGSGIGATIGGVRRPLALLTVATLSLAGAAAAQVAPGAFDRAPQFVAQNIRSEEMGACALRHDRRHAVAIVTAPAGSDEEHAAVRAFMPALTACLAGARSATLDASYMRGGIAEALLAEDDGALLRVEARRTPVPPTRLVLTGVKEPNVLLMGCAAAAMPADAAAMLTSPAGSPAEAAAFTRLGPALQACVPATGEVHLKPARVRPATAIALYRQVAR